MVLYHWMTSHSLCVSLCHSLLDINPLSPNVADLQHFDIEFFVASLFATLFAQELTLLQLV